MATAKVKYSMFFTVKDGEYGDAEDIINTSPLTALAARYKPADQTLVFFAAARPVGEDAKALALCQMLVKRGIDIHHRDELHQTALFYAARQGHAATIRYLIGQGADPNVVDQNGETAMFFAVLNKRTAAVKALLQGRARLDAINNWHHTCVSVAPPEVLPVLQEEHKKRRIYDDSGPGPKRRRTPVEQLRAWANEWPIKERVIGKEINFRPEDVITAKKIGTKDYAVLRKCPAESAARLRVSEKQFVLDHAVMMEKQRWFRNLKPEDWCEHLAVITDAGNAVECIKGVLTGNNGEHFTLPLVQTGTGSIAGYVHAAYSPAEQELSIEHVKVDEEHMGQGLGGMLIDAAEEHSESIGWKCRNTSLSVLKANARAKQCYKKAGFRVASGSAASWGKKQLHVWSEWQKLRKVHKSALKTSVKT